jgi:hypothetical protein
MAVYPTASVTTAHPHEVMNNTPDPSLLQFDQLIDSHLNLNLLTHLLHQSRQSQLPTHNMKLSIFLSKLTIKPTSTTSSSVYAH